MRLVGIFITVTVFSLSLKAQNYQETILEKRAQTDSTFMDSTLSILPQDEIADFKGLHYFPVDESYKISASFKMKMGKPFEMQTSTSRLPIYQKYGEVTFELSGQSNRLSLYRQVRSLSNDSAINDYLFCPFRDLSNKDSTYGGGRYMDFKLSDIKNKEVIMDFNTCYNPYCAYSYRYSCPVPPKENTLNIRVNAGVKKWHD
jgi:uncharacterized protein